MWKPINISTGTKGRKLGMNKKPIKDFLIGAAFCCYYPVVLAAIIPLMAFIILVYRIQKTGQTIRVRFWKAMQ